MTAPSVSVVMPAHNAVEFLDEAVESVLGQTFADFELLAIDDRSTDGTRERLEHWAAADSRMRVVGAAEPGFVGAVMTGVHAAHGEWIARMDADDRSRSDRLAVQMDFLRRHGSVGLLGTTAQVIGPDGTPRSLIRYPLTDGLIRLTLASHTAFAHGSVLMRRDDVLAVGGYRSDAFPAEDYDLWCRLVLEGVGTANLDEPLYEYRLSPGGTSRQRVGEQRERARRIGRDYVRGARDRVSLTTARRSVVEVVEAVEAGRADPRSLRRASRSLVDSIPRWFFRAPATASVCLVAALSAERAYRQLRASAGAAHADILGEVGES